METVAFATMLFLVYFSMGCYICTPTQNPAKVDTEITSNEPVESLSEAEDPHFWDKPTRKPTIINIEKLSLRSARKIAKKLKIAQKVNGKDAPLSWLRSQIHNQLNERPQEVIPLILEVLAA